MRLKLLLVFLLLLCVPVELLAAPQVTFSTFFGGSGDGFMFGITTDANGAVYVVGTAGSTNFPTTHTIQPGGFETFVAKFSADGRTLLYSTVIGSFTGRGIAVDAQGNAYVVGMAGADGVASTNAAQARFGGGNSDAAVIKLSPDGSSVVYSTFLGGSGDELAKAIAVDDQGNAYITGSTTSTNLPATTGAAQTRPGGGTDAFVAKINPAGTAFVFVSYLGGTNNEAANGLAVDGQYRVYVTGQTMSAGFANGPTPHVFGPPDDTNSAPVGDAFVVRLTATGASLDYLALIRGSAMENGVAVAVDATGRAVVTGVTASPDFPATANAATRTFQGFQDLFVVRLAPAGDSLEFATYLGSDGYEGFFADYYTGSLLYGSVALNGAGDIYLCANTSAPTWPGASGFGIQGGPIVLKLASAGDQVLWLKFLGGSEGNGFYPDSVTGLARSPLGALWAAGYAVRPVLLPVFPTTKPLFQNYGGGSVNGFLASFTESPATAVNSSFATRVVLTRSLDTSAFSTAGVPNVGSGGALWWTWVAPSAGRLTLRLDPSLTNVFAPILTAYSGTALGALTPVATNLQSGVWTNQIRFSVQAGIAYQITVGAVGTEVDEGLLSLQFSAPVNDDFATPAIIASQMPITVSGSNVNATTELGETAINYFPGINGYGRSVWWQWTAPSNVTVSVSVAGSDFAALVQAYQGATLDNTLRAVTSLPLDQITFDANAGATYRFAVFGQSDASGNIQLAITKALPPSNDTFTNATLLVANASPVSVSSRNATPEAGEPQLYATENGFHSVWWKWTAAARGFARLSVWNGNNAPGVGVFTGPALNQLQLVGSPTFSSGYGTSNDVFFAATQGVTYYFLVNDQVTSAGGTVNIALQVTPYLVLARTFTRSSNGNLSFAVAGEAGTNYQIQTSLDLRTWSPLPGGTFTGPDFTYVGTSSDARRFYRVAPAP